MDPSVDERALDAYSRAVVAVVEKAGPAVVSVRGRKRSRWGTGEGAGSGFVVTPDGYVATNSHVVSGASEVRVVFPDGTELTARTVGDDPATDLALLRIPSSGLAYLPVDGAVVLRPGQLVVAIGNPLGFDNTVSTGVLSAVDRTLPANGRPMMELLQHTAPLNPGNSGGPLVASDGTLIGVNTAIIPVAQGMGFAVPVHTVAWVVPRLLETGRVVRGYLGITGRTDAVRPTLVSRYGSPRHAVRVEGVEPGSPAANGGLQLGDLVVAVDGAVVDSIASLHRRMADARPGRPLGVVVLRGEQRHSVDVTPIQAP